MRAFETTDDLVVGVVVLRCACFSCSIGVAAGLQALTARAEEDRDCIAGSLGGRETKRERRGREGERLGKGKK